MLGWLLRIRTVVWKPFVEQYRNFNATCMQRVTRLVLGGTLFWLTASTAAFAYPQDDTCRQRRVDVNVISRKFQVITDLNTSQFAASYHGKPARILSVTPDRTPHRVFILLDASGSMKPFLKFAFHVAEELLSDLPADTQVGYLVFATQTIGGLELTANQNAVREHLEVLRNDQHLLRGNTSLLKAILDSVAQFGEPKDGGSL